MGLLPGKNRQTSWYIYTTKLSFTIIYMSVLAFFMIMLILRSSSNSLYNWWNCVWREHERRRERKLNTRSGSSNNASSFYLYKTQSRPTRYCISPFKKQKRKFFVRMHIYTNVKYKTMSTKENQGRIKSGRGFFSPPKLGQSESSGALCIPLVSFGA